MTGLNKGADSQSASQKWGQDSDPTEAAKDPDFPHAPPNWTRADAEAMANSEDLEMLEDHWDNLRALQEYCSRHDCNKYSVRELHDALDEKFHSKGGYKYLYALFPGGPIAQGCRLAGLEPPAGAIDKGFGSVV